MIIWIKRVKLDVSPSLLRHYLCLYFKFIQVNVLLLIIKVVLLFFLLITIIVTIMVLLQLYIKNFYAKISHLFHIYFLNTYLPRGGSNRFCHYTGIVLLYVPWNK